MSWIVAANLAAQTVLSSGIGAVDWAVAGGVVAGALVVGRLVQIVVRRSLHRGDSERLAADAVARMIALLVVLIGLLWSLSILGIRLGPLVGALGVGGIALAFAAQAILANFLGSIILQLRRPFRRGDQIATGTCEGTVEDVNFRTVVLRTFDGERVLVPCTSVLANPITNHTALGRRRTTLPIGVAFDTDLEQARKLLLAAVETVDGVLEHPPSEVWVRAFGDSSVTLDIRVWHAPDVATLWRVRSAVAIAAKGALDEAGIDMPVPQREVRLHGGLDRRGALDSPGGPSSLAGLVGASGPRVVGGDDQVVPDPPG
ncbi:MAG: small conductance mechanosensitive channel [Acidimicrobiaceae bacterium]|jgi:small-conductance mechanosensitive channel|nr:small conductance mechanosensitive channel [Acidimicrobiaceae bacterium]